MNLSVNIAGVELKNPVMTASGTFGSGMEYSEFVDLNCLGAVVTKGDAVIDAITKAAEGKGLTAEFMSHDEPLYIPLDSHLITTLAGIYTEETGDKE